MISDVYNAMIDVADSFIFWECTNQMKNTYLNLFILHPWILIYFSYCFIQDGFKSYLWIECFSDRLEQVCWTVFRAKIRVKWNCLDASVQEESP